MGSFLGNAWNAVKKAGTQVGHVAGEVASNPLVEGAAGLVGGPAAAAAVGGLGHLMAPGGNLGTAVKGAVTGGAAGLAGSAIGKALPVVGSIFSGSGGSPGGNTGGGINGDSPPDDGSSGGGGGWSQVLGDLTSVGGDIASLAKKYGTTALEAYTIVQAAQQQAQATQYGKDALATAKGAYDAKAPLRTAGQAGMLNPGANTPDLSNIRALATTGSGNPFAKSLPVAGVATKPPGYSSTGTLNSSAAPSLPVAGSQPLPQGITPSGNPLPPGAQSAIDAASHAGTPTTPGSTVTTNYGGQQYTPAQWSTYQQSHPNWATPTAPPVAPKLPVAAAPTPTPITPTLKLPVAGAYA